MEERYVALLLTVFVFGLVLMYGNTATPYEPTTTGFAIQSGINPMNSPIYRESVRQAPTYAPDVLVQGATQQQPTKGPIAGVDSTFTNALTKTGKSTGGMFGTGYATFGNKKNLGIYRTNYQPPQQKIKSNCYNKLASNDWNKACASGKTEQFPNTNWNTYAGPSS